MISMHNWSLGFLLSICVFTPPRQTVEPVASKKTEDSKTGANTPMFDPLGSPQAPKLVQFSKVKVLSQPSQLTYPKSAKDRGLQGEVLIELWANSEGVPTKSTAIWGPDEFRSTAEKYCSNWRFAPYLQDSAPIPVRFRIRVSFNRWGGGDWQHVPKEYMY